MSLIDWLAEPFALGFQQRALVGGILAGLMCSIVGTWLVLRGMAFFISGIRRGRKFKVPRKRGKEVHGGEYQEHAGPEGVRHLSQSNLTSWPSRKGRPHF